MDDKWLACLRTRAAPWDNGTCALAWMKVACLRHYRNDLHDYILWCLANGLTKNAEDAAEEAGRAWEALQWWAEVAVFRNVEPGQWWNLALLARRPEWC